MSDFEDAIVAAVAQRENADYIVTRNCADFVNSPVLALLPTDFLELMKNGKSIEDI
jgi:predicted nucleic acid-binding protein